MIFWVVDSSAPSGGYLRISRSLGANSVEVDVPVELLSLLCVYARQPSSGLTIRAENSVTKSAKTWPLITTLGKKFTSNCSSSASYSYNRSDKFAFIKIFFSKNSVYTIVECA